MGGISERRKHAAANATNVVTNTSNGTGTRVRRRAMTTMIPSAINTPSPAISIVRGTSPISGCIHHARTGAKHHDT